MPKIHEGGIDLVIPREGPCDLPWGAGTPQNPHYHHPGPGVCEGGLEAAFTAPNSANSANSTMLIFDDRDYTLGPFFDPALLHFLGRPTLTGPKGNNPAKR